MNEITKHNLETLVQLAGRDVPSAEQVLFKYEEKNLFGVFELLKNRPFPTNINGDLTFKTTFKSIENQQITSKEVPFTNSSAYAVLLDQLIFDMNYNLDRLDKYLLEDIGFFDADIIRNAEGVFISNILALKDDKTEIKDGVKSEKELLQDELLKEMQSKVPAIFSSSGNNTDDNIMYKNFAFHCRELIDKYQFSPDIVLQLLENVILTKNFSERPGYEKNGYSQIIEILQEQINALKPGLIEGIEKRTNEYEERPVYNLKALANHISTTVHPKTSEDTLKDKVIQSLCYLYSLTLLYIGIYSGADYSYYELNKKDLMITDVQNNINNVSTGKPGEMTFQEAIESMLSQEDKELEEGIKRLENKMEFNKHVDEINDWINNNAELRFDSAGYLNCDRFHIFLYFGAFSVLNARIVETLSKIEKLPDAEKKRALSNPSNIVGYVNLGEDEENESHLDKIIKKYSKDKIKELIANFAYIVSQEWSFEEISVFSGFLNNFSKIYATGFNYARYSDINSMEAINFDSEFKKMEAAAVKIRALIEHSFMDFLKEIFGMFLYVSYDGQKDLGALEIIDLIVKLINVFTEELTLNFRMLNITTNPKVNILKAMKGALDQLLLMGVYQFLMMSFGKYSLEDIYVSLVTVRELLNESGNIEVFKQEAISVKNSKEYKALQNSGFAMFYGNSTVPLMARFKNEYGADDILNLTIPGNILDEIKKSLSEDNYNYNELTLNNQSLLTFVLVNYFQYQHFREGKKGSILYNKSKIGSMFSAMKIMEMKILLFEYINYYGVNALFDNTSFIFGSINQKPYGYPEIRAFNLYNKYVDGVLSKEYINSVELFFENNKNYLKQANIVITENLNKYYEIMSIVENKAYSIVNSKLSGNEIYSLFAKFWPTTDLLIDDKQWLIEGLDFLIGCLKIVFDSIKQAFAINFDNMNDLLQLYSYDVKVWSLMKGMEKGKDYMYIMLALKKSLQYMHEKFDNLSTLCSI